VAPAADGTVDDHVVGLRIQAAHGLGEENGTMGEVAGHWSERLPPALRTGA
jgi:hypothetical protein